MNESSIMPLFRSYPFVVMVALLSYTVGHVFFFSFSECKSESLKFRVFLKTFVGYLISVALYAVIRTGGNTVFLGSIPVYIYFYSKQMASGKRRAVKEFCVEWLAGLPGLALLVSFALLVALAWCSKLYRCFSGGDYIFYSGIADAFNQYGVESSVMTQVQSNPVIRQATFYHYGDIGGAAFLARLCHVPATVSYIYVMLPFLAGLTTLGLYSWCASRIRNWSQCGVALIVLVISLIAFRTLYWSPKLLIVGVFMVWFVACYQKSNSITQNSFPLVFLSIYYQAVMPPVVFALLLLCIYKHIVKKEIGVRSDWLIPCYILLWFAAFYCGNKALFSMTPIERAPPLFESLVAYYSQPLNIIAQFMLCARYTGGLMLYALGLLVVLGGLSVKKGFIESVRVYLDEILFATFALLVGIAGVILFPYNLERGQPIINLFRPLIDVLVVFACGHLLSKKQSTMALFIVLSTFIYCNSIARVYFLPPINADEKTVSSLKFLQKRLTKRVYKSCYICNAVMATVPASTMAFVRVPFSPIRQTSASFFPECLSIENISPDPLTKEYNNIVPPPEYFERALTNHKNRSPFWRYYRLGDFGEDVVSAQVQYVLDKKIDYLFVQDGNPFLGLLGRLPVCETRKVYWGRKGEEIWNYIALRWDYT